MKSVIVDEVEYRFFSHLYAVSENGGFLRQLQPFYPRPRHDGYLSAGRRQLAHRMVATCWLHQPEGAKHVHHKNGCKTDNRAENLEWVTPQKHIAEYHGGQRKGCKMSDTAKEKLRQYRLGCKTSEATKQKQREASLRLGCKPPSLAIGSKLPESTIAKMKANHAKNTPCIVHGVEYPSFTAAALALGERPLSLRKRCLSLNYPDYRVRG